MNMMRLISTVIVFACLFGCESQPKTKKYPPPGPMPKPVVVPGEKKVDKTPEEAPDAPESNWTCEGGVCIIEDDEPQPERPETKEGPKKEKPEKPQPEVKSEAAKLPPEDPQKAPFPEPFPLN